MKAPVPAKGNRLKMLSQAEKSAFIDLCEYSKEVLEWRYQREEYQRQDVIKDVPMSGNFPFRAFRNARSVVS